MNYAEAKKKIEFFTGNSVEKKLADFCEYYRSGGYLEAFALAEKLAEAVKDILNHGLQYENGEVHQADPDRAKEALSEFEKAKGEK